VCGVDVRGGAPGTRETDLLDPVNLVEKVHAIYIGGGSAFGLDGASGVMKYLEEKRIGFDTGIIRVPIVPGAIIFDLGVGSPFVRPDKEMGYRACLNAKDEFSKQGNIGAGAGCTVGKAFGMGQCMKAGLGIESIKVGELIVGALAVVNAFGDIVDPETNSIIAGALSPDKKSFLNTEEFIIHGNVKETPFKNTTIGVVATNAKLTKAMAKRVAMMAQDGIARTIRPAHTMFDGDTVFALSTGEVEEDVSRIGIIAAKMLEKAIVNAVKNADSLFGITAYKDLKNFRESNPCNISKEN
ncbi:MAG: peptidase S58, partial [Caldiserica bacterium CG17_big_fil_post_rev_8_21_14_2_50_35_7]